jgi:hypothetical protein
LHSEELTNETLVQLDARLTQEEQEEDETPPKTFDKKKLQKLFAAVDNVTTILDENNPNLERSRQCKTSTDEAIQCYPVLYDYKKREAKQTSILSFFVHQLLRLFNLNHQLQEFHFLQFQKTKTSTII